MLYSCWNHKVHIPGKSIWSNRSPHCIISKKVKGCLVYNCSCDFHGHNLKAFYNRDSLVTFFFHYSPLPNLEAATLCWENRLPHPVRKQASASYGNLMASQKSWMMFCEHWLWVLGVQPQTPYRNSLRCGKDLMNVWINVSQQKDMCLCSSILLYLLFCVQVNAAVSTWLGTLF